VAPSSPREAWQEHPLNPAVPSTITAQRRLELPVPARLVVLLSGSGTLLQSLLDAEADFPATVVAVGSDRHGVEGLRRAERAQVPTFVVPLSDHADRSAWDAALTRAVADHDPDLVVCAGFMKLLGPAFLAGFGGRVINSHPALLPAFPGAHAVRDALAYGAKVTGCSIILVDGGVDSGPLRCPSSMATTSPRCMSASRSPSGTCSSTSCQRWCDTEPRSPDER
jgi:phosphoribosylglycinamide formyltransferase 1